MHRMRFQRPVVLVIAVLCLGNVATSQERKEQKAPQSYFFTDVSLFSIVPETGKSSFKSFGGGGSGGNSTIGLTAWSGDRAFEVEVKCRSEKGRLSATISVKPEPRDTKTVAREETVDLSSLAPFTFEVAKDADGRVYRLNITPTIKEPPSPRLFNPSNLRLEAFSFPQTDVILNEQAYLGSISMSHGNVCSLDIAGFSAIEFSLLHLTDAKPDGVLQDGTIRLTREDGTSVRLTNVRNGQPPALLPGGPHQIWVRWKASSKTPDEAKADLAKYRQTLTEQISAGADISPIAIRLVDQQLTSEHPLLINSGFRAAFPGEIVEDK